MKKLVYVDPQSYRNLSQYDYSLLKGMRGYKIIYCCNKQYDGPLLHNVEFFPIFTYRQDMNPLVKIISYLFSLLKLVGIIRAEKPDVLHIQWWKQWHLDYFFLSIYKRYAKQVIFTAHNLVPHDSGDSMKHKCTKYYKRVNKIIVHDKNSKNELIRDFGIEDSKIAVIAHGILTFDANESEINYVMDTIKEKYQLQEKLVFSTMGGQNPYKGTDLICDAFASSDNLQNNKDIFLFIAGKGNIANQEFANRFNNVMVADYELSDSEFQAIMRLTDVMLLPYRKISQSGVLLTAIQNQIPFAVTPIGGLVEPLDVAPVGWVIPSATIEQVRKSMEKLSLDIKGTKAVKQNQQYWDLVKTKYDWEYISVSTENFYEKELI